jgi:two-component system, OmpR family, sensor histidine kinase KdpD
MDTTGMHAESGRGRHWIFLGYAVGVGKTCAMLREGLQRKQSGEDVVIGFLEPHGRRKPIELARGLETMALMRVDYRGVGFDEFDADASIARRPEWLLVDELAHSNVPGAPLEKRWQSIGSVLEAGIDVMSTVNVQHVESLKETVFQVTGMRAVETVPDRVLDEADRVVLVDMPVDQLIWRLKRGRVLDPDELSSALTHFFRRSTLSALRTQALGLAERHANQAAKPRGRMWHV